MLRQNPEYKKKILMLKEELYDGIKYINGMNGFKIYEQVLGEL